jgi:hypothetical protein
MRDQKNQHLNLFHFYGQYGIQYLEDNLTRGLAICLENDPILLDRFLRKILGEDFKHLFKTEGEKTELFINVQQLAKTFEGIQAVYGVPLTTKELEYDGTSAPKGAENPRTDLSIQIGDQLILIEVKRTAEDCREQLKNQIKSIRQQNDENLIEKNVEKISWGKIMELIRFTLKYESEVSTPNLFSQHFYEFVKLQFPSWFENIPLREIHFPDDFASQPKLREHIEVRLNIIKQQLLDMWNKERQSDAELVFSRANIPVTNYSWVDEINIEPVQKVNSAEKFIALRMWPGDTKNQGNFIFSTTHSFKWPEYIYKREYQFVVKPYIKFSHMQGLCWVWTEDLNNPVTHTKEFFWKYAGKWNRNQQGEWTRKGAKWEEFNNALEQVIAAGYNWKRISEFNQKLQQSQRSYFYVSIGFAIEVLIPYHIAQQVDGRKTNDKNDFALELKIVADQLLDTLDKQFSK